MNKEEYVKKLYDELYSGDLDEYKKGYNEGVSAALCFAHCLDEFEDFEKPVLTKEEAEWLEDLKETKGKDLSLCDKADLLYYITRQGFSYGSFGFYKKNSNTWVTLKNWDKTTKMRLAYALFRDYTVEPEKRYTAKLKSTDEYLHYNGNYDDLNHFGVPEAQAKACDKFHFTKEDLVKYHAWKNDAYDVKLVKVEGESWN